MLRRSVILSVLTLVFVCAISAQAQSRLIFPRLLAVADLPGTGFALVNTSSVALDAKYLFYSATGQLVTSRVITVPAKGQVARLGSEIFVGATSGGWVLVTSANPELQGFELIGDFTTSVDTAGSTAEALQLAVIAFSREDVLNLVNTSSQSGIAQVGLTDANGASLGTRSVEVPALGAASLPLGDIDSDNGVDVVSISANVTIAASVVSKLPSGRDVAVTNAVNPTGAPATLFFSFTPNGPQGNSRWTTLVAVTNLSSSSQTVSMTFTPDDGPPTTVQRVLAPRAVVTDTAASLIRLGPGFVQGWIQVSGSAALTGVAAYQDSSTGALATAPSQSGGATRFFFSHIASGSPWYTGVALLNATTNLAVAELSAIDTQGRLLGSPSAFFVQPGQRLTRVLTEFVQEAGVNGGYIFIRTVNNVPLLGFELFGHA